MSEVVDVVRQHDAKPKRKNGASTFAHIPMPAGIGR
jgi:hypothetical protein